MSRSYKHTPIAKDGNKGGKGSARQYYKNYSNRVVRRNKDWFDLPSGKFYRKLVNSWDIYDYITFNPWVKEINAQWNKNPYYVNYGRKRESRPIEEIRFKWEKWYLRK